MVEAISDHFQKRREASDGLKKRSNNNCYNRADALTKLARDMVNAGARNYYLTVARELRERKKPKSQESCGPSLGLMAWHRSVILIIPVALWSALTSGDNPFDTDVLVRRKYRNQLFR